MSSSLTKHGKRCSSGFAALGGFAGILAFTVLLAAVTIAAEEDGLSVVLLALYAAWVGYDIARSFAFWRGNRGRGER